MIDLHTNLFKIGRSKSVTEREDTLLSQAPMIRLLGSYKGFYQDELNLHEHFKEKRRRGEWFELNETSDLDFIDSYFKSKEDE